MPLPKPTVPRCIQTQLDDPQTGKPIEATHLGDVVKNILLTSPAIRAENTRQLAEEIGLHPSAVRDWWSKGNSPSLENLSIICANLRTDVIRFFLQSPVFQHGLSSQHEMLYQRIGALVSNPDRAVKLLDILTALQRRGLLEGFLDQQAAQLGVDPGQSLRALDPRSAARRKHRA